MEEQAIDRVHRIGQQHNVVVKRFIIMDSVEDRILELQVHRFHPVLGTPKSLCRGSRTHTGFWALCSSCSKYNVVTLLKVRVLRVHIVLQEKKRFLTENVLSQSDDAKRSERMADLRKLLGF